MEYSNPKCAPLPDGPSRELNIPADGYGCTSSPISKGPYVFSCYVVNPDGSKTELRLDKEIQVPQSVDGPVQVATANGAAEQRCTLVAEGFWYGPKGSVRGNMVDVVLARHPECR